MPCIWPTWFIPWHRASLGIALESVVLVIHQMCVEQHNILGLCIEALTHLAKILEGDYGTPEHNLKDTSALFSTQLLQIFPSVFYSKYLLVQIL